MSGPDYLTNQLLVAMPALDDPNFERSVTYICQHDADGALGIVINRPSPVVLGDILKQLDIGTGNAKCVDLPVWRGGPIQTERGFILHSPTGHWESSLKLEQDLALTTSRDVLAAAALGNGPEKMLVALGYAGWQAGQLETELAENTWLSAPADPHILFDLPAAQRWQAAARSIGVDPGLLSGDAGHA